MQWDYAENGFTCMCDCETTTESAKCVGTIFRFGVGLIFRFKQSSLISFVLNSLEVLYRLWISMTENITKVSGLNILQHKHWPNNAKLISNSLKWLLKFVQP